MAVDPRRGLRGRVRRARPHQADGLGRPTTGDRVHLRHADGARPRGPGRSLRDRPVPGQPARARGDPRRRRRGSTPRGDPRLHPQGHPRHGAAQPAAGVVDLGPPQRRRDPRADREGVHRPLPSSRGVRDALLRADRRHAPRRARGRALPHPMVRRRRAAPPGRHRGRRRRGPRGRPQRRQALCQARGRDQDLPRIGLDGDHDQGLRARLRRRRRRPGHRPQRPPGVNPRPDGRRRRRRAPGLRAVGHHRHAVLARSDGRARGALQPTHARLDRRHPDAAAGRQPAVDAALPRRPPPAGRRWRWPRSSPWRRRRPG